jgi:molybdopterin-synthase adenylyltransferase
VRLNGLTRFTDFNPLTLSLSDQQRLRYSRHLLLDGFSESHQQRLQQSTVLVVGLGGLGSAAASYLASAGVGHLMLADGDTVDLTNLQRQIVHSEARVGLNKAQSAAQQLGGLNSDIRYTVFDQRLDGEQLEGLVKSSNLVLDCTDNFVTRQAINAACVKHAVPLVFASAVRLDGQLMVIDPRQPASACYACVFSPNNLVQDTQCATLGVLAPLVGWVGCLQAIEAIKLLSGFGEAVTNRLLMLDARQLQTTAIGLAKDPLCPVCGKPHD